VIYEAADTLKYFKRASKLLLDLHVMAFKARYIVTTM
jgi:hypothetical protein